MPARMPLRLTELRRIAIAAGVIFPWELIRDAIIPAT